jgi:hypothetical protein
LPVARRICDSNLAYQIPVSCALLDVERISIAGGALRR